MSGAGTGESPRVEQAGKWDGPHQHAHIAIRQSGDGAILSVTIYEIYRGKRRFSRAYPFRRLSWKRPPMSGQELERRVALALDREFGA